MTLIVLKSTSKTTKAYLKCVSFYNKHFPTDRRTFNVRISVLGLVLSICSLHLIGGLWLEDFFRSNVNNLIIVSYVILATGAAFELYWGLKIGDRKQYTPWIVLKFLEITLIIIAVGSAASNNYHYYHYDKEIKCVYTALLLFFNCFMLHLVVVKSVKHLRSNVNLPRSDDEHLDDFPQEARTYDNV